MVTWLDVILIELNKEYRDLEQEVVLNAPEKFIYYIKITLIIYFAGIYACPMLQGACTLCSQPSN